MKKRYLGLCFLISAGLLNACGSNNDDNGDLSRSPQEQIAQDFSTRLSNSLLISGTKCDGGETTEYNGQIFTCEEDEWLVTIDNVNTCDAQGSCTEVGVIPIVAEMDLTDITSFPDFGYFEIDPDSPTTTDQLNILNNVYVRFDINGKTEVIYRSDIGN